MHPVTRLAQKGLRAGADPAPCRARTFAALLKGGGGLNPAEIESGRPVPAIPVADSCRVARPGIAIPGPGGAGTIGTACPFNASRTTAGRVMVERLQLAMPCGRSRDMDWPCDHAASACRYRSARIFRVGARWLRLRQGERIRRFESRRAASYRVVRSRGRTVNASSRRVLTVRNSPASLLVPLLLNRSGPASAPGGLLHCPVRSRLRPRAASRRSP